MDTLLSVKDLTTQFTTKKGIITPVDGVSFDIKNGEILGIVGESGCGKSVTSLSILGLLATNGKVSSGSIIFDGVDLLSLSEDEMCEIRGNKIAMIFQDPLTALNPTMNIGNQVSESFVEHRGMHKKEADKCALEMLKSVGIPSPERRMKEYPHQLSGGMRQRVMIAMALSCKPNILIADEPTTALDVSIQAQILELIRELRNETNTAIMLITHDLGVVAQMADKVLVMYAGKGVESAPVNEIFENPKHPYTVGLLKSLPRLDEEKDTLYSIEGTVPSPDNMPLGCRFAPRCPNVMEKCKVSAPPEYISEKTAVSCFLYEEASHEPK